MCDRRRAALREEDRDPGRGPLVVPGNEWALDDEVDQPIAVDVLHFGDVAMLEARKTRHFAIASDVDHAFVRSHRDVARGPVLGLDEHGALARARELRDPDVTLARAA